MDHMCSYVLVQGIRTALPDPRSGYRKEWVALACVPFQPSRLKPTLAVRKAPFLRFHRLTPAPE